MKATAQDFEHEEPPFDAFDPEPVLETRARPLPRISIQALCDDAGTADVVQLASEDRRWSKAHVTIHPGGALAAAEYFRTSPTPNLIIIDSMAPARELLAQLDALAESCDAGTKVIVIGHVNDVVLYRELLRRGVSEYQVAPLTPMQLMECVSDLYASPSGGLSGQVFAFVGAKGGTGSSTVCHNVAWAMTEQLALDVVVSDLDIAFGTAGLDFDKDPEQGIADALMSPERLDQVLLDRLLTKCSQRLSLFAAPATLARDHELTPEACEVVVDVVRQSVPYIALDLPHIWSPWVKHMLLGSDEIIIVAEPDLANLRNTKNMIDFLRKERANDNPPRLVMNMVGKPKRQEISIADFAQNLGVQPFEVIEYDAENFSQAAINGQMVEAANKKAKATAQFRDLALRLTNRPRMGGLETKSSRLAPILQKLGLKK